MKTHRSPARVRIANAEMREALKKIAERADEGAYFNRDNNAVFDEFAILARLAREALAKAKGDK